MRLYGLCPACNTVVVRYNASESSLKDVYSCCEKGFTRFFRSKREAMEWKAKLRGKR